MNLKFIPCLILVLIVSSCATVHKNGYHQSRKYKPGKHFVKHNKTKQNNRFNDTRNNFLDNEKQTVTETVVEHNTRVKTENEQIAGRENKPLNLDEVAYACADCQSINSKHSFHTSNLDKRNKRSINLVPIHLASIDKTPTSYNKKKESRNKTIYAKISFAFLILFAISLILLIISGGYVGYTISFISLIGFLVFGLISFFLNKNTEKWHRERIVKIVNVSLAVSLALILLLFFYLLI